ncbi:MAG: hypothetical protein RL628_1022 [Actinomycetota bacterium]
MIKVCGQSFFIGPQFVDLNMIGLAGVGCEAIRDAAGFFVASCLLIFDRIGNCGVAGLPYSATGLRRESWCRVAYSSVCSSVEVDERGRHVCCIDYWVEQS